MEEDIQIQKNNKRKYMYIVGPVVLLIALIGITYAFFNYTRTGLVNNIGTGRIYFNTTQGNTLYLTNVFPIASSEVANSNIDSISINIIGDTTYTNGQEFEISIVDVNNTIISGSTEKVIPINYIATYIPTPVATGEEANNIGTNSNDYFNDRGSTTAVYKLNTSGVASEGKQVLIGYIPADIPINGTLTIKVYLDAGSIAISDTYDETSPETDLNGTTTSWVAGRTVLTTSEWNNLTNTPISFKIKAESNEGIWVEEPLTGTMMVQRAITAKVNAEANSCNPIWTDPEDGIIYFSGTNDCVDMNYVWYSGKLWRITAIYPNGSMKLVTEDNITSISWGSDVEYDGSWVYQWLNEDFYDTLYNANNIIENVTWNYSTDNNRPPVRPETIEIQKTKTAPVGLLNAYEYYNSYRCIESDTCTGSSYSTGYLNIGYYWWLITPSSTSGMHYVITNGYLDASLPWGNARGVRPSINLKSGLEFTGDGSKSSPYIIKEDKEDVVNNTTLLSSRSIGEYVNFNNDLYRIVDTSDGITKLTRVDYLRESGTVITKNLSSTVYFGKSGNTQSDDYWDYYLNNTWYNSISSTYKNMLVDGIYYLRLYGDNTNYKATICKDADLNSVTTKNCTKYTSSDADKTFTGKVGLPRVGEMFSSQLGSGYLTSSLIWLITPYNTSNARYVSNSGNLSLNPPSSSAYGVRPSINLKSTIKITGGTGMENDPFEISE